MSALKSKLFRKIFEANADDIVTINDKKEHVITQDTFVPLMGEMWERAKMKYKKRYISKTFKFTEWCASNYYLDYMDYKWRPLEVKNPPCFKTSELFEIWKKEN